MHLKANRKLYELFERSKKIKYVIIKYIVQQNQLFDSAI